MNVFELFATLGLDTSSYDKGLEGAQSSATDFGSVLTTGLGVAAGVATTAIAATAAATVATTEAFWDGITATAEYGDEIDKTSQKLGLSTDAYQEWDYVLNIAGTSMSNMTVGMKTLTNQLDDAKNGSEDAISKFEQLGISLEDIQTMSREDLFEQTIYGFQNMADSTERAALANDLFGRSGQELTPLFNMTAEETQELIDTANEYGMVMSEDAVAASAGFQDSLTTLENTVTGLKNNLLSEFLPSVSTVMDGLSAVFAGDQEGGLGMIEEGINSLADNLTEITPTIISIGTSIITSLASAITKNLPTLISSGIDAILTIVDAIVDNADELLVAAKSIIETFSTKLLDSTKAGEMTQAAVEIIIQLVEGISEALPEITVAVTQVLIEIVSVLTRSDNLSRIIVAITDLVESVSVSLLEMAPTITNAIIPVLWNVAVAIITALPDIIEMIFTVGLNYLLTKWSAILGIFGVKFEDIKGFFETFGIDITNIFESLVTNIIIWFEQAWNFITSWIDGIIATIKEYWTAFLTLANTALNTALDNLRAFMDNPKEYIENTLTNIKEFFINTWDNIKNAGITIFNNIKNAITTTFNFIKSFIPNAMDAAKNTITSRLENIKSTFTSIFDNVKNTVENAINFIKGLFSFEWSLPKIKLPHFSITGSFDLLATPPTFPTVGIEWYKKAMDEPYILNEATIFGASGGKLLGAGESGSELVIGTNKLIEIMKKAVGGDQRPITINVYGAEGQDVRELAKAVSQEMQYLIDDKGKVYA